MTPYKRELWLEDWPIVCHGMNLRHWLLAITCAHSLRLNEQMTKVQGGRWICPYTGAFIEDPHDLDIDHVIPLAYVHDLAFAGSKRGWRHKFATDLRNLQVVSRHVNDRKGDQPISQWTPLSPEASARYAFLWTSLMLSYRRVAWPDADHRAVDAHIRHFAV